MNSTKIQKLLIPVLVTGIATKQVYKDLKNADSSDKKNVFIRDMVILGGTCVGAIAGNSLLTKAIPENQSKITKSLKHLVNNLSMPIGGIIGGLMFSEVAERAFPKKHSAIKEAVKETIENNLKEHQTRVDLLNKGRVFADQMDMGTIGKAYSYLGSEIGGAFDNTFSTLSGFKVGREKGLKNKVLKASNEIVAGVIIPVTTVVAVASYLKTKNINGITKGVIIAPVAIASSYLGNIVGTWFNNKIMENVIKKEFWEQITDYQKNWKTNLLTSGFSFNQIKARQLALEEMKANVHNISKNPEIKEKALQIDTKKSIETKKAKGTKKAIETKKDVDPKKAIDVKKD